MKTETIEFSLINASLQNIQTNLFDINSAPIPERYSQQNPFYISSVGSYNQFVKDMETSPKKIIKITLFSTNTVQLFEPFDIFDSDANGQYLKYPEYPNVSFSPNQYQSGMTVMYFTDRELILNGSNVINQYTVNARANIKMLITYVQ